MCCWLFMVPMCCAASALFLWCELDVGEEKLYRGRAGIKRLLLHSLVLGAILAAVGPYLPMW